jgi:hypothetical protein
LLVFLRDEGRRPRVERDERPPRRRFLPCLEERPGKRSVPCTIPTELWSWQPEMSTTVAAIDWRRFVGVSA